MALNPLTDRYYVANVDSDNVTFMEDNENGVVTLATVAVGSTPYAVAVNPLTNKIYVANVDSDNVTIIDGATNSTATVPAGTKPFAIAVNPVTNKIYIANIGSNNVTVIDGDTNETITIAAGESPFAVAVNSLTNKIYIANVDSDNVTVIDGASHMTVTVPAGAGPNALAVNPLTGTIYVANFYGNNVTAIDGTTGDTSTIPTGITPNAVAVNEATGKIYVANDSSNNVTVIDGLNLSTSTVSTGMAPNALAVHSAANKIYVANYDSHDVTVIDGVDHMTSTIAVGTNPIALAFNSGTNKIYVANFNSDDMTIIEVEGEHQATNADLGTLALSAGSLSPAFAPNMTSYTVHVEHAISQMTVTASTYDPAASLSVTGQVYGSSMSLPVDLQIGANVLPIVVQEAGGTASKTYTITIYRADADNPEQPVRSSNAELSQLMVSTGTFQPAFAPGTSAYTMDVGNAVSSVSVTAVTYDTAATMRINGQQHGSGIPFLISLQTGSSLVSIATTAEDGVSKRTYTLTVNREGIGSPYNPDASSTPIVSKPDSDDVAEGSNGVTLGSGAATVTTGKSETGKPMVTVMLHADALTKAFGKLAGKATSAQTISFAVTGTDAIRRVGIPAQALKAAAGTTPNAVLSIKTGNASYNLPINLPTLTAILEQLGDELEHAAVYVTMETVTGDTAGQITEQAKKAGVRLIGDRIDFTLTVEAKERNQTISGFGHTYVTRSIRIAETIDPAQATAVMVDYHSGSMAFVPSFFITTAGGETFVTILHPGNGLYAVVQSRKSFADVHEHWAKSDVELLASKLIVNGKTETSFAPEHDVTRAEFVSLIIRALGLKENKADSKPLNDIAPSDWFAGAVGAALQAQLISGFDDGSFRPNEKITREQMAVIVAGALSFAGGSADVVGKQHSLLAAFEDKAEINAWAKVPAAQVVQAGIMTGVTDNHFVPGQAATRAEAAVVVKRLLQAVEFIN
ncbi:S-layer homology domain-containing protein [Paenibacillus contaminans]|nr:S-layer homology domain-containing protein [Paenibacillus contaminans]